MTEACVCQNCNASVRLPAVACWMCRAPHVAVPAAAGAEPPRDDRSSALGLIAVGLVALLLTVIFVALLFEAPGLAVGYAVLAVPLVAGLGAVAFAVNSRRVAAGKSLDSRGDARPGKGSWLDSAAKAMVIVIAIIVGIVALGVVALVLFAVVCFGIIAAAGVSLH